MAKLIRNGNILELRGSIGNLVFRRMPDGSTHVCAKPDFSNRVFSRDQKAHQERFKQAAAYAREAAKTLSIYAELAEGTTKNAYNLALSDWFHPPVIQHIERKGGVIRILASDNVRVTEVQVTIIGSEENVLEQGQAEQVDPSNNPERWEYFPGVAGTIEAMARDLAGNETKAGL